MSFLIMPSPTLASPILAPPGAGLPKPELWIARILFAVSRWSYERNSATDTFLREQRQIGTLVNQCALPSASQRILIPRLRGLEDSSRDWSVWMTLDHLRITNNAFSDIIRNLTKNMLPPGVASTAAVKPSPEVTSSVLEEYNQSCFEFLQVLRENPNLSTELKFAHPWFGGMNAESWHLLAGIHMGIHRKQIEAILARLA
jgi:hypothetical protein